MLKLLLKQAKNMLKEFGLWHWFQLLLVISVVSAYLIMRACALLPQILQYLTISDTAFAMILPAVYGLFVLFSSPFILLYLFPRQKELLVYSSLPLDKKRMLTLLGYYYLKYLLFSFLVFLVPAMALTISALLPGIMALLLLFLYTVALIIIVAVLYTLSVSRIRFLQISLLLLFFHLLISALCLLFLPPLWLAPANLAFYAIVLFVVLRSYALAEPQHLVLIFPATENIYRSSPMNAKSIFAMPRFLPFRLQALFNANLLSVWRNPRHKRLKIFTLLFYFFVLAIIKTSASGDIYMWLTLAAMAFIYLHYSNYFSKKYILPEPDWYFLTLPLRYRQIWISKFLAESVFVLMLLFCHWLFLFLSGATSEAQLNLMGLLILFSFFTVSAMLNFQILFYDDPRLGGYAYHFMILLILVMTINYHLVGPVLGLFLLILNFYKSYQYFNA